MIAQAEAALFIGGMRVGSVSKVEFASRHGVDKAMAIGVDHARPGFECSVTMAMDAASGAVLREYLDRITPSPQRPPRGQARQLLAAWPPEAVASLSRYWRRAADRARGRAKRFRAEVARIRRDLDRQGMLDGALSEGPTRGPAAMGGGEPPAAAGTEDRK